MKTFRRRKSQLGQGMTEYIIIVALVAIAAIGVYRYFGQTVNATTAMAARGLAGQATGTARTAANTASGTATTNSQTAKNMGNFETVQ
jgi:type IV pilus assembly protein PilA